MPSPPFGDSSRFLGYVSQNPIGMGWITAFTVVGTGTASDEEYHTTEVPIESDTDFPADGAFGEHYWIGGRWTVFTMRAVVKDAEGADWVPSDDTWNTPEHSWTGVGMCLPRKDAGWLNPDAYLLFGQTWGSDDLDHVLITDYNGDGIWTFPRFITKSGMRVGDRHVDDPFQQENVAIVDPWPNPEHPSTANPTYFVLQGRAIHPDEGAFPPVLIPDLVLGTEPDAVETGTLGQQYARYEYFTYRELTTTEADNYANRVWLRASQNRLPLGEEVEWHCEVIAYHIYSLWSDGADWPQDPEAAAEFGMDADDISRIVILSRGAGGVIQSRVSNDLGATWTTAAAGPTGNSPDVRCMSDMGAIGVVEREGTVYCYRSNDMETYQ